MPLQPFDKLCHSFGCNGRRDTKGSCPGTEHRYLHWLRYIFDMSANNIDHIWGVQVSMQCMLYHVILRDGNLLRNGGIITFDMISNCFCAGCFC